MAVVQVDDLTKRFGSVLAVDGVSFSLTPGSVTGFLGPNGAGKTTTLRMLLGLVNPTSGRALIDGRPYVELDEPLRAVGSVLDPTSAHPARTARATMAISATAGGIPPSRCDELLAQVGLADVAGRRVGTFSLGMRQRLNLAVALLGDPRVLVLDEPANGLDPEGIRWLRGFLRFLADQGRTVLVSSHVLSEVAQTVDTVVIIANGLLVRAGPLSELAGEGAERQSVRTTEPERLAGLLRDAGAQVAPGGGDTVHVEGWTPLQIGEVMAAHSIVVLEMTGAGPGLEETFLRLTGQLGQGVSGVGP